MKTFQVSIVVLENSDFMVEVRHKLQELGTHPIYPTGDLAALDAIADRERSLLLYERNDKTGEEQEIKLLQTSAQKGVAVVPLAVGEEVALGPWTKTWETPCAFCKAPTTFREPVPYTDTLSAEERRDPITGVAKCILENLKAAFQKSGIWAPWGKVLKFSPTKEENIFGYWHIKPKDPSCSVCNAINWQTTGELKGGEANLPTDLIALGREKSYLSRLYHENSKIQACHRAQDIQVHEFTPEMVQATLIAKKEYPASYPRFHLPDVKAQRSLSIEEAILKRRSRRKYKISHRIALPDFAALLFYGNGITGNVKGKYFDVRLIVRAAPSGGALYPIELYFAARNVQDIPQGIYYYDVYEHTAIQLKPEVPIKKLSQNSGYPEMVENAAALIVLTAIFDRNQWKYWNRGYRVLTLDAGHIAENIHLMATARNIPSCCMMGYVDDVYNEVFEVDGKKETVIYMIVVGGS